MTKKLYYYCPILALGLFIGLGFRSLVHLKVNNIEAKPAFLNLGTVLEGNLASGTIRIVNTNDRPLHVNQITTSCGCTSTGKLSTINPHRSEPLRITFDSSQRPGRIDKQILVFTKENPDTPLVVRLGGIVKQEWKVQSPHLDLGKVEGGATCTGTFIVSRASDGPVSFATTAHRNSTVKVISDGDRKTAFVQVSHRASRLPGKHEEEIVLKPIDNTLPALHLQLSYTVNGQFTVSPETLNYGVVIKSKTPIDNSATISSLNKRPTYLHIVSVPKGITAHVEKTTTQEILHVSLSDRAFSANTLLNDRIVLATGNEKQPQIVVPVLAIQKDSTQGVQQ